MTIRIDSREQRPYKFELPVETGAMPCGDYSLCNLENHIAIERKTIDDLIGCLTTGRDRFERELHKSRALEYFALVIEGTLEDLSHGRYQSKMDPKAAIQSLVAFSVRYRLPIWFAGDRKNAERLTENLLQKYVDQTYKRFDLLAGLTGQLAGNKKHE